MIDEVVVRGLGFYRRKAVDVEKHTLLKRWMLAGRKYGDDLELCKTDFGKVSVKSLFVWVR